MGQAVRHIKDAPLSTFGWQMRPLHFAYVNRHMTRQDYLLYGARSNAKRGTELPQSKLNPEKVRAIRSDYSKTAQQWADELGVSKSCIVSVRCWQKWAHVQ